MTGKLKSWKEFSLDLDINIYLLPRKISYYFRCITGESVSRKFSINFYFYLTFFFPFQYIILRLTGHIKLTSVLWFDIISTVDISSKFTQKQQQSTSRKRPSSINMKKLNIFHPKKRPNSQELPTAPTDTLGRIVNAKEEAQRSWEQEQVEFANRRREHEIKMIEMEQVINMMKIFSIKK